MSVPADPKWVPIWDTGAPTGGGGGGGSIPGEVKLWGGKVLPNVDKYGVWVWADGAAYLVATYPEASTNIAPEWKTHDGKPDPGAGQFRVPDLRGLTPVGLDQMPGGARANRVTRAVAIILAAKTGEETHIVTVAEMPSHDHPASSGTESADHAHYTGGHAHYYATTGMGAAGSQQPVSIAFGEDALGTYWNQYGRIQSADAGWSGGRNTAHTHGITVSARGGSGAHETMQPSVFVPYIVALDS